MEVLIEYCMNSFPQVDQFIRIQISFYFLCFPIGLSVLKRNLIGLSRSNRKLINFLSNELINLRKGIGAIFYQHFHCIDSNYHAYITTKLFKIYVSVWKSQRDICLCRNELKTNHKHYIDLSNKAIPSNNILVEEPPLEMLNDSLTKVKNLNLFSSTFSRKRTFAPMFENVFWRV